VQSADRCDAVNVSRLLLDMDSSSENELVIDIISLLSILCTSEPVKIIGIWNHCIISVSVSFENLKTSFVLLVDLDFCMFCYISKIQQLLSLCNFFIDFVHCYTLPVNIVKANCHNGGVLVCFWSNRRRHSGYAVHSVPDKCAWSCSTSHTSLHRRYLTTEQSHC